MKTYCPERRWNSQTFWRRPGSENIQEGQGNLPGESDGSSPTLIQDSSSDDGEARNDFRSISENYTHRHHVEPRVKLFVAREGSFPIPLRYIDVTRATSTTLDVTLERRKDDYWNIDGARDLSDAWTRFTRFTFTFLKEKPPDGKHGPGERLTKKQTTSRPGYLRPEIC